MFSSFDIDICLPLKPFEVGTLGLFDPNNFFLNGLAQVYLKSQYELRGCYFVYYFSVKKKKSFVLL